MYFDRNIFFNALTFLDGTSTEWGSTIITERDTELEHMDLFTSPLYRYIMG